MGIIPPPPQRGPHDANLMHVQPEWLCQPGPPGGVECALSRRRLGALSLEFLNLQVDLPVPLARSARIGPIGRGANSGGLGR
jgi:hypothetical protein